MMFLVREGTKCVRTLRPYQKVRLYRDPKRNSKTFFFECTLSVQSIGVLKVIFTLSLYQMSPHCDLLTQRTARAELCLKDTLIQSQHISIKADARWRYWNILNTGCLKMQWVAFLDSTFWCYRDIQMAQQWWRGRPFYLDFLKTKLCVCCSSR